MTPSYKRRILEEIGTDLVSIIKDKFDYDPNQVWTDLKKSNAVETILKNYSFKLENEQLKLNHWKLIEAFKLSQNSRLKTQILTLVPEQYSNQSII